MLALALGACSSGLAVLEKTSGPGAEPAATYAVRVGGGASDDRWLVHEGLPGDEWVRHCYQQATVGQPAPYYCTAGYTPNQMRVLTLLAVAMLGLTWAGARTAVARMPARDAVAAAPPHASPFLRYEAEKRAYAPVWRAQWRLVFRRYALRASAVGALVAVLLSLIAAATGAVALRVVRDWAFMAGVLHVAVFAVTYGVWAARSTVHDEATHSRILFGAGMGFGLLLGALVLGYLGR